MARSSRSSVAAAVAAVVLFATAPSTSGHRLDEYLQAARVTIEPDHAAIDLDLTPGVAVAGVVVPEIDRNRDGSISSDEARVYAERVCRDLTLTIDRVGVPMAIRGSAFPAVQAIRAGVGTIQLQFAAVLARHEPGPHRLELRNDHLPSVSAYLANALVPASALVEVTNQGRDYNQRVLDIDYVLRATPKTWWDFIFQQKGTL